MLNVSKYMVFYPVWSEVLSRLKPFGTEIGLGFEHLGTRVWSV